MNILYRTSVSKALTEVGVACRSRSPPFCRGTGDVTLSVFLEYLQGEYTCNNLLDDLHPDGFESGTLDLSSQMLIVPVS